VSQAPGWYRDPFHRGQERYWDGRVWTQGARPEAAEEVVGTSGDSTDASDRADQHPASTIPGAPAVPPTANVAPAAASSFAPLGAPVQPFSDGAVSGVPSGAWAPPTLGAAGPQHARRDRRARHVMYGIAAAALVLVAGGVSTAVVLGGSGNASAQEAVANAAAQTMNSQSADMSMSIDVSILGMHENVSANGAMDFAHKVGTMTMTIPVNGQQYTEQEIMDGSTVYVNIGGLGGGLAPAKPWVSENVGQLGNSSGLNTLDPTSMLRQLQTAGGTVTSLGQTTYDGTSVTEYAATLPASAMMGEIGKLPSSLQQGVSGLNLPDMHMNIYVTQDHLLKALSVPSYSVSFSGQTMSMDMTMVLSNYGIPVNVTPPPADQVQPLSQLGGGLGNGGSTGTTGSTGNTGSNV
jgi:hypothetical protein